MQQSPGAVIKGLRERTGLTVREVAERAKVSESYFSRAESGKVTPSDTWLAYVVGVLADALMEKTAAPAKEDAA